MTDKKRVVVIGSGIGGLSAAASLAQTQQYEVEVYERLSFAGGRFTQHDHDGYAVPTGAVHMIPHGCRGPFYKLLMGKQRKGGLNLGKHGLETRPVTRFACQIRDGVHRSSKGPLDLMSWFSWKDRLNLPKLLLARTKKPPQPDETLDGDTWLRQRFTDEFVDFMDAFVNFAVSVRFYQMPASTTKRMLQNCFWSDRPHVPMGGCKSVIDALRKDLRQNGAKVKLSHEITEIIPGDEEESTKGYRFAVGIRRRGREDATWVGADGIIHNGGHPNLLNSLSDDFEVAQSIRDQVRDTKAAGGIGFVFGLDDEIPHRDSGVTMLPGLDRVGGYVIPTFTDPSLAPQGRHMMITHQYVPDDDIRSEIAKGRENLYEAIPWLDKHGEEICVHAYHRNWPCNRTPQGSELPADIGVEGIRLVGDGVKGHGWMMIEGITSSVPGAVADIRESMRQL
ncbi:MAG TPA: NAD(P)/FAD-dependent oxidoreductase [Candidatus Poseidoniales archaeon]|nr:NAD(P)/FAD-dependent oxidoreductase [Candidatus Poseidoniales archaeon]